MPFLLLALGAITSSCTSTTDISQTLASSTSAIGCWFIENVVFKKKGFKPFLVVGINKSHFHMKNVCFLLEHKIIILQSLLSF